MRSCRPTSARFSVSERRGSLTLCGRIWPRTSPRASWHVLSWPSAAGGGARATASDASYVRSNVTVPDAASQLMVSVICSCRRQVAGVLPALESFECPCGQALQARRVRCDAPGRRCDPGGIWGRPWWVRWTVTRSAIKLGAGTVRGRGPGGGAAVRAFVPLLAGFARMLRGTFCAYNVVSAMLWAPVHILLAPCSAGPCARGRERTPGRRACAPAGGPLVRTVALAEADGIWAAKPGHETVPFSVEATRHGRQGQGQSTHPAQCCVPVWHDRSVIAVMRSLVKVALRVLKPVQGAFRPVEWFSRATEAVVNPDGQRRLSACGLKVGPWMCAAQAERPKPTLRGRG